MRCRECHGDSADKGCCQRKFVTGLDAEGEKLYRCRKRKYPLYPNSLNEVIFRNTERLWREAWIMLLLLLLILCSKLSLSLKDVFPSFGDPDVSLHAKNSLCLCVCRLEAILSSKISWQGKCQLSPLQFFVKKSALPEACFSWKIKNRTIWDELHTMYVQFHLFFLCCICLCILRGGGEFWLVVKSWIRIAPRPANLLNILISN